MQGVPLSALAFSSPHTVFGPPVDPVTSRTCVRDRAHDSTVSWGKGTRTFDSIDNHTFLNGSEAIKNNHSVTSPIKNHRQHDVTSLRMSDASRTFSVWANGPPQCREMEMKINNVIFLNHQIKAAERLKSEIQGNRQGVNMQVKKGNMVLNERECEWEKETRRENGNKNERVEDENVRGKKKEKEKAEERKEEGEEDDSRIHEPRSLDGLCDEFHHLMRQLEGTGTGTSTRTRTSSKPLSSSPTMPRPISQPMSQPISGRFLNRSIDSPRRLKNDLISDQSLGRQMHDYQRRKEQKLFSDHEYENCNKSSNEYENKVKIKSDDRQTGEAAKEGEEEDVEGDAMDSITLIDAIKSMTHMQQQQQQERGQQQGQERGQQQGQGCSLQQVVGALQNRISSDIARMRDRLKDQTGEGVALPVAASSSSSSSSSSSHPSTFPSSSSSSTHHSYPSSSSILSSNHPSNRNVSHVPGEGSSFADHRPTRDNNAGNTIPIHDIGRYNTVNQIEFIDFKGDTIDRDGSRSLTGSIQSTEYTERIVTPLKSGARNADAKGNFDGQNRGATFDKDERVYKNTECVGDRQDENTLLQGTQEDVRYITQESTEPANQYNRTGSWVESGSRSHLTGTEIRVRKPIQAGGTDRTIDFLDLREYKSENEDEYDREENVEVFRVDENVNDDNNNHSDGMGTRRVSKAKHVTRENKNFRSIQNKNVESRRTRAFKQSAGRTVNPVSSSSYALPSSSLHSAPSASFPLSSSSPSSSPMREISKHAGMERVKRGKKGKRGKDIGGGTRVIASKRRARQSAGEEKGVEEGDEGEEEGNNGNGEGEGTEGKEIKDEEEDTGGGKEKHVNEEEEAGEDETEEDDESRISDESDSEVDDNNDDNNDDNHDNEELSKENKNKNNNKIKRDAKFLRNSTIHATHPTRVSSIRQSFNDFLEADQHSHNHNHCAITTTQDTKQQPRDRRDKADNDGERSIVEKVSDASIGRQSNRYQEKYKAIMTAALGEEGENNGEEKNGEEEKEGEGASKSGIGKDGLRWQKENENAYMGRKDSTLGVSSTALKRGSGEKNLSRRTVKDSSNKEGSVNVAQEHSVNVAIGGMFVKSYYEDERSKYHQKSDDVCSSSSSGDSEEEQWSGWNADSEGEGEEEEEEEIELVTTEGKEKENRTNKKGCKDREGGQVIEVDSSIGNSDEGHKRYKSAENKSRGEIKKRLETKKSTSIKKRSDKKCYGTKGGEEKVGEYYDIDDNGDDNEEESGEKIARYKRGERDWSDFIRAPRYTESEEQKKEGEVEEDGYEDEVGGEEGDEGEIEGEVEGEEEEDEMSAHRKGREPCDVTERYSHCLAWVHMLS
jgi:hypothetical protein